MFSVAVLAVLIVVNVLLLLFLFSDRVLIARTADQYSGANGPLPTLSSPASGPSASASDGQTPSASDTSTGPPPSSHTTDVIPVQRLLLAVSSDMAWRATVGDCNTAGELERSTNGGASWKRIVRTGPIVRLGLEPGGDVFTVGGTRGRCSVRYVAYAGDGTIAASTSGAGSLWYPDPSDRDEINGPGGTKATPCNDHAISLAPFDLSRALVVCDNGDAIDTHNSGKTWRRAARIPNTLAVAAGSGQYWVAGVREDCEGVAVQSLTDENGSLTRGRTSCALGLDVAGGQVAMDVADGKIWLWSGNRTAISTDDGDTWK